MARPHTELGGGQWKLWRLTDDEFVSLGHHALPVTQHFELLERLQRGTNHPGGPLQLGQALTALERKLGPSSPLFDSFRGSFSFPLLITFERGQRFSYVARCHDYRGLIHLPLYRVVSGEPTEQERAGCHPPIDGEFSREEIDRLTCELFARLRTVADAIDQLLPVPFCKAIQSDVILYGFDGVRYFEVHCDSWHEFETARDALVLRFGLRRRAKATDRVDRLIDRVTDLG